ncbi:MAG: PLP-dependent transferase [Candidatus Niyogibacteria bacterium]|nr:PLP-dependent transferase [Candidatus Niyogibacteria bacterium]
MKNKNSIPLVRDAAFRFKNVEIANKAMTGKLDHEVYTRWAHGNPTVRAFEEEVAYLEFRNIGESSYKNCLASSSGMATILQMFYGLKASGFLEDGDEVISSTPTYMTTIEVMQKDLPLLGMKTKFVDASDSDNVEKAVTARTKVIFVEFLANPTLRVADVKGIAELAKKHKALFVVDNSFASAYYFRPLEHDAHLVVHSATKFINGHGDVVAGVIVGKEEHMKLFIDQYHRYGACMAPDTALLLLRSLKTFDLRLARQGENAEKLAAWLQKHPKIKTVHYPGLPSFPQHELAKSHMATPFGKAGYGGMVSVEMHTGKDATNLLDTLSEISSTFIISVSLGFTETRGEFDAGMVHAGVAEKEMEELGLCPTLIRFSIGVEEIDQLVNDFDTALKKI